MTVLKDRFGEYLKRKKKVSENTLNSYLRDIDQFLEYLDGQNIPADKASGEVIGKYIFTLESKGRSKSSVNRMLSTIRCFYRFMNLEGECLVVNPASGIKSSKPEHKAPEILSENEIETLISAPDSLEPKGCRDRAMLELLYATGIRVSELVELKVEDVNLQVGLLHCRSGKNERVIPIYDEAAKAVKDYLDRIRGMIILDYNETVLFTNMNGSPMTRQGFWKIIKTYAKQTGINKDITPQTLRHSFAAHLLENGAQLSDIKEMLGHSDISSTQMYARLIKEKYKNSYSHFHPKARRA